MKRYSILSVLALLLCVAPLCAQSSGWKQLFDGKNLDGWQHVGPGGFTLSGWELESLEQ